MSFQGMQDGHFDLLNRLAEELLAGGGEQLVFVHDLALRDSGDSKWDTLSGLHVFTHGIQGHHLAEINFKITQEENHKILSMELYWLALTWSFKSSIT